MKNKYTQLKNTYILICSLVLFGCSNSNQPSILGYEFDEEEKVNITIGNLASLDIITKYFEGYNNKDLVTVESLEHEEPSSESYDYQYVNYSYLM